MPAARTRNTKGERFGRDPETRIGGLGSFNDGWLPRPVWVAAAAVMFLLSGAGQLAQAQSFTVIHKFAWTDGAYPHAGLVRDALGNLYGTTVEGGSPLGTEGYGTVFKIDPSGNETVLHSFTGGAGGSGPSSRLVRDASGNLYGTTERGGSMGLGTVFKIDATGNFSVLHSFIGTDGSHPSAGLVRDASGNLYGTASGGGTANYGVVFKIDLSGNEAVLHNFAGGTDGANPEASLVLDGSGNLYGTTRAGGTADCGTVFKIDPTGNNTVLHSFAGGTDGATPVAEVVLDASGNLYGTTRAGGTEDNGTVFKIDASWSESVLHSFNGTDGEDPRAGLIIDPSGNLYGTTVFGGPGNLASGAVYPDEGTVFKIDAAGNFSLLHSFAAGTVGPDPNERYLDGAAPDAGLILDPWGNLYGTAWWGGNGYQGYGTVFKIALSVPFASFSAKLDTKAGPLSRFELQAFFTQGAGASAIDPVTQGMTLMVGTYTVTIPPAAFHQTKKGWFVYEGTIGGAALEVRISQKGANLYELQVEASRVDLTSLTNPVTVKLALGYNTGTTGVNQ